MSKKTKHAKGRNRKDVNKMTSLLLALMFLGVTPAVSEAADITSETELEELFTTTGGDGEVKSSISTSSPITATVNDIILHSDSDANTLSGAAINLIEGTSLKLYDLAISNQISFASTGAVSSLVLGDKVNERASGNGLSLGSISGSVDVSVETLKNILFNNDINVNKLTIDSNSTTARITYNGNVSLVDSYLQNAGQILLAENKAITAKTVNLSGGSLQLGAGSSINATGTDADSGKVVISGATINNGGLNNGTITANQGYVQSGAGTSVKVDSVNVSNGDVSVSAGTLNANKISAAGNIALTGGSVNVNKSLTTSSPSGGYVLIDGANVSLADGTSSEKVSLKSNSTLNVNSGSLTTGKYSEVEANGDIEINSAVNLGSNSTLTSTNGSITVNNAEVTNDKTSTITAKNTYQQTGATSNVTAKEIKASNVVVADGTLNVSTIGSVATPIAGTYKQAGTSNVSVDNLNTTGDITVSAGKLTVKSAMNSQGNISNAGNIVSENANIAATGNYTQTAGSLSLSAGNSLSSENIDLKGGSIVLGSGSSLSSREDVTVSGNTVITNSARTGSISALNKYIQKGASQVTVDDVTTVGDLELSGGTLTTNRTASVGNDLIVNGGTFNVNSSLDIANNYNQTAGTVSAITNNINVTQNALLTGGNLYLGNASNPNIELKSINGDVTVTNANINSSASKSGKISAKNYIQSGTSNVNINEINTKMVDVSGGTLTANSIGSSGASNTLETYKQSGSTTKVTTDGLQAKESISVDGGELISNGNIVSDKTYSQSSGKVTVSNNRQLNAGSLNLTGGEISLGNGASIVSSGANGTNGNITVVDSTISKTISTNNTEIVSAGNYVQSGASNVSVDSLTAANNIDISGGILNAKTISGGSYSQSGNSSNVTVDNIITKADSTGTVTITGGSFTINNTASVGGDFTVTGAATRFINNCVGDNFKVNGKFTQDSGTITVIGDNKTLSADSYSVGVGSTLELLKNATVATTTKFEVNGGTVTDVLDGGDGTGTINAGRYYVQDGATSNVTVSQINANSDNGTVELKDGTLNVGSIGSATKKIFSFIQSKGDANITNGLYTAGDVAINGGTFDAKEIIADGAVNVANSTIAVESIGKSGSSVSSFSQTAGSAEVKNLYSSGNINISDGATFIGKASGKISADGTVNITGTTTTANLNSGLTANSYRQEGATVNVANGMVVEATLGGASISDGATLNLGDGSTLKTTGGNSSISVSNGSVISGTNAIIDSNVDYNQTGATTSVNVQSVNAKKNLIIGSSDKSGGSLQAVNIGLTDVSKPLSYLQYGSSVVTDYLYSGANGVTLEQTTSSETPSLKIGRLLSTEGSVTFNNAQVDLDGNILAEGSYEQNYGSIDIAANKYISANQGINIVSGNMVLANGSALKTTNSGADINIIGSSNINSATQNLFGDITAQGSYIQNSTGNIYVNQILTGGGNPIAGTGVKVSGTGTLTANSIGTLNNQVGYYTQGESGAPTVNVTSIQTSGDVTVSGGKLTTRTIGTNDDIHRISSYTQNNNAEEVNIGAGGINSTGNVSISAGKLTTSGNIDAHNGSYIQSGSSEVILSDGKTISSNNAASLTGGALLNLGSGSTLDAKGGLTVSDSASIKDATNNATVKVTGAYTQDGTSTDVSVKNLLVSDTVTVTDGVLTASQIGEQSSSKRVKKYVQGDETTYPNVTVTNMYVADSAELKSGTLTVNGDLNSSNTVVVAGGILNVNDKVTAGTTFTQSNGEVNVAAGKTITANDGINLTGGNMVLLSDSTLATINDTADITVSGNAKINGTSRNKTGVINSSRSYIQDGTGSTVYVKQVLAKNNVIANNGVLKAESIGTSTDRIGGSYQQSNAQVSVDNIYANDISISGGTLEMGSISTPSTISASKGINISGGTLNLNNTTFEAINIITADTPLLINGATVNVFGNTSIGAYAGKYIYAGQVGNTSATTINIGDGLGATDILNIAAGAGNFNIGSNALLNIGTDGILNLDAAQGDIIFAKGSKTLNEGVINIISSNSDKKVTLSDINDVSNFAGRINMQSGNTEINGTAFIEDYIQNSGSTTILADSALNLSTNGNAFELNGGSLNLSGDNAGIYAVVGKFSMANGTELNSNGGSNNTINALYNDINGAKINVTNGSDLTITSLPTGSTNISSTDINVENGAFTVSAKDSSAIISGSNLSAKYNGTINVKGNTSLVNSTTNLTDGANLNVDSTDGNVDFDANSEIKAGANTVISIKGDGNKVSIDGGINSTSKKTTGSIEKTGSGVLDINSKVYGNRLTVSDGTTNIKDDVNLSGTVTIDGSTIDGKTAIVNIASGKSLKTTDDITVGSLDNYNDTILNLDANSLLSGRNVSLNAIINAVKATISADKNKGGIVSIGEKTNLTVSHYDGDGTDITKTIIRGSQIKISGGSTIDVKAGAQLVYDGTVVSDDAHYDIAKGGQWTATEGTYSNSEYQLAPGGAVLTNRGDVVLNSDVTFTESNSWYNGGAIYNEGTIRANYNSETGTYAENIGFSNNKAGYAKDGTLSGIDNQSGGAIYNTVSATGDNGIILLGDGAFFRNNVATGLGGAIYNDSEGSATEDAVTIGANSDFSGNRAWGNGGAVYTKAGTVTIGDNATFSSNMAGFDTGSKKQKLSSGGALYVEDGAKVKLGKNAVFTDNMASANGGAIYNAGNLSFTTDQDNASAIFARNGHIAIGVNNHYTEKGGAIYNKGTITTTDENGNVTTGLNNAIFGTENESDANSANYGGALYSEIADGTTFTIKNSLFRNNKALTSGGGVYNASGILDIESGTQFVQNKAGEQGGAIYNAANATVKLEKGTIIGADGMGNSAKYGGGIYNVGDLIITAGEDEKEQVNFVGNKATLAGGAIYNNGNINSAAGNTVENVNFVKNTAGDTSSNKAGKGGAIYNENGTINIVKSLFDSNEVIGAASEGGAIYNAENGIITIGEKAIIQKNKATGSVDSKGGALANYGTANIKSDSSLILNETSGKGGAIYNAESGILNIGDGTVIGGLLSEYYNETTPTAGNKASLGGGIYNDGTLNIDNGANVYIVGNEATDKGGGLYYNSNLPNTFSTANYNMLFYGNKAENEGGGIYNSKDSAGLFIVSKAKFDSNSAKIGSAIYNAGNMYIANDNVFRNNTVGSAIGNEGTLELAEGFEFGYYQNTIPPSAGALYIKEDGVLNLSYKQDQTGNYSLYIHDTGYVGGDGNGAVDGAGLHLTDNAVVNTKLPNGTVLNNTLYGAIFADNTGFHGGGLYKDSNNTLKVSNSIFSGNKAVGALSLTEENQGAGGAIYNVGKDGNLSKISIDKSTMFIKNKSTGKGGAIYNGNFGTMEFDAGYVMGEDTQGYSNIAEVAGGAIANEGNMIFKTDATTGRSIYFKYQGGGASDIYNGKGGALYVGGNGLISTVDASGTENSAALQNAVFTNNESMYGGALYKDAGRYKLDISKTQFSGNRGYKDGGAVYNQTGELNFILSSNDNNIFVGNQAGNEMSSISSSGRGGAIFNAGVMNIVAEDTALTPEAVFVSNTATGEDGQGGAIYNTSDLAIGGNIAFVKNSAKKGGAIASSGDVVLDLTNGDIVFSQNTAEVGSAIFLNGGSLTITDANAEGHQNTLTFVDADESQGIIAQTIASEGANALTVRGGNVNFFSDASGYGGTYYQTGGVVTVKNKFLNIADGPIRTVTGGTFILDKGAELSSDYLLVSNVEPDTDNKAKIIFNKNDKATLTDLSALYENTATNNYFVYGNEENSHKISLRAADVEINDVAEIKNDSVIGNAKNSYAVRNLTLSNGAKLNAQMKVYGGTTSTDEGAALTLNEGALGSEKAGVELKGYNAKLNINNTSTAIELGGKIANDGTAYSSEINKTGAGTVTVSGDASGYDGKYTQNAGLVEFVDGSKFFGKGTMTKDPVSQESYITGGTLKIADGVEFENGTVVSVGGNSTFSTSKQSQVDLTGTSGAILTMVDPNVRFDLGQNTTLEVTNNATVNAVKDVIRIGNDNLQVNSIILGGLAQKGGSVDVTLNPTTRFVLQNDSAVVGAGGVLGFGENVKFHDVSGNAVVPTIQLKDYTQLKFTNENDSSIALNIQSIDDTENVNPTWGSANGDIVKENKGTMNLSGDIKDFHGSLVVKDGEIATVGTKFAADVVHDLTGLKHEAKARVSNVTYNDDVVIAGDISSEIADGKYELNVENDRGKILVKDSANNKYGNVNVKNGSTATFSSAGGTYLNDLVIKNSTVNLARGDMFVGGNVSMGSTFNMMNGAINTQNIAGNMVLTGNSDYKIDINPMFGQSDKVVIGGNLSSDVAGTTRALDISEYNLLTDPTTEYSVYKVFDVKGSINDVVFTSSNGLKTTPIANYLLSPMGNSGSYMLARLGFTPAALVTPVAMQGAYLTQIASYDAAFGNMDTVMTLPVVGYQGNKYADSNPDDTIVYSPLFIPELEKGLWFRPYGNFEKVDLQDGPSVDNQMYGAMVGGDTPLKELGNGFQGNLSAYVGYNGAHQSFDGVSNYQNGGMIGVTGAVYKGGFFSGLTVNANAGINSSSTPFGHNDFFMLSAGVASKTGYNWELARGRFIIQPSWLMSYSFVNAFSPESIMGRSVDAQALNAVQLAPGVKFIANLPYGWQPYLTFNYRFNLGDEAKVKAGNVDIPEMSVKSYVEYGLGMQKRWGNRFTGFGQVQARNIGRNGVGLNLGLRWTFGRGR